MSKEKEIFDIRKKLKKESINKRNDNTKLRLKRICEKKFRTCFIAALAEFEKVFGLELWGHGLPCQELTPIQIANKIRWEQTRQAILNKGNTQSRAVSSEIDLHEIKFLGYKMEFGGFENG